MQDLKDQRVIVTGGSSGLGLGVVEALAAHGANITVVARDAQRLAEVATRLGVNSAPGDVTDRALATSLLREIRPTILVLNAGSRPPMGPLHEQSWEGFSEPWNSDVKAGFHWIQEALRLPLERGSRVLVVSSGAAVNGSPMSGGYAGAKRMLWIMASYANGVSAELDLGIRFQAVVPRQMTAAGGVGRMASEYYSNRKGITQEQFLAGFGKPLSAQDFGDYVVRILTEAQYEEEPALGIKADYGIEALGA
ncbi:short chain dehydrogenase [Dyella sp. OK004]|uniref:SDR family oxidoreductase n=1 Tax=Dyella sp. OK004 TaxID=1855292 RepID=UPI0008E24C37|nr:SDR family NAD(P)-dependent oxidoreductase [Dyella sp. OK004]SFS14291.1 short chain dehydrogenase [Dyella sp. OK004]